MLKTHTFFIMTNSHFCLSSNTYKKHVFEGFSQLQQRDEFVDMTLAAEGHLVKVHQTLIALASPYLKELLRSVPCRHPVLFLSNISHEVLCFILEYIYTGEVKIPYDKVQSFLNAAQAMHIAGLDTNSPPLTGDETREAEWAKHVYHGPCPLAAGVEKDCCITENIMPPTESQSKEKVQGTCVRPAPNVKACITIDGLKNMITTVPTITNTTREEQVTHHGFHTRPPGAAVKACITLSENDFALQVDPNIQLTTIEQENEKTDPLPATTYMPEAEEINEVSNLVDVTEASNTLAINIGPSNTNENISQDPICNMEMFDEITSENIVNIPIVVDGQFQVYSEFLNGSREQEHDMPVDISISDLIDCDNIATPSTTNETTESRVVQKEQTNDLLNCGNDPRTIKETIDGSVINKDHIVEIADKGTDSILYTISNRGSLQMIMNNFMYYCHYQRGGGQLRRWRCIEYRDLRCRAAVDTDKEVIVTRKQKHCHPNHDKKIWNKVMKSRIFSSIKMAQDVLKEQSNRI